MNLYVVRQDYTKKEVLRFVNDLNEKNRIDNLYALCRKCHTLGHADKELNEQWKKDLLERIEWKKENPDDW